MRERISEAAQDETQEPAGPLSRRRRKKAARSFRVIALEEENYWAQESSRQIAMASAFILILFVYILGLPSSLPASPAAMLIEAVRTSELSFFKAMPLYYWLAKLASALPLGEFALRLNVLSSLCFAVAAALVCDLTNRGARSLWPGLFASTLFATAAPVWRQATEAGWESSFVCLSVYVVYVCVRYFERPEAKWLWRLMFVVPMGVSLNTAFCWPAAVGLASLCIGEYFYCRASGRAWLWAIGALVLGSVPLLVYSQLTNFRAVWLLSGFALVTTQGLAARLQEAWSAAEATLLPDTLWVAGLLVPLALAEPTKRVWRFQAQPLAMGLIFLGLLCFNPAPGQAGPFKPELVLALIYSSIFVCIGIGYFACLRAIGASRWVVPLSLALVILQLGLQGRTHFVQDDRWSEQAAEKLLRPLPERSTLITRAPFDTALLGYAHEVLKFRPDLRLMHVSSSELNQKWLAEQLSKSKVYLTWSNPSARLTFLGDKYLAVPKGIFYEIQARSAFEVSTIINEFNLFEASARELKFGERRSAGQEELWRAVNEAEGKLGNFLLEQAIQSQDAKLLDAAAAYFEKYLLAHPKHSFAYKNLGLAYWHQLKARPRPPQPKIKARLIEVWSIYLSFTDLDRDADNVRVELEKLNQ